MFKNQKEYQEKRNAMLAELEKLLNEGNIEGFNAKEQEIKDLDAKFEAWGKAQANLNALKDTSKISNQILNINNGQDNVITPQNQKPIVSDPYNSAEYRTEFMNFCKTGVLPNLSNADVTTTTTDAGAVIPTTIMKEIIKEMKEYGQIFSRIRGTNIQGGVEVPILTLKPKATWIGENSRSEDQKVTSNTNVTFTYHGLECRIAISLLAEIVTLDMFEAEFTKLTAEAMVIALETAIIKGSGVGQPLGLTVDPRIGASQLIVLSPTEFSSWSDWKKKVMAKIPLAYRNGGTFIMAAGTFEGYIDNMNDANGQPIGRINYNVTKDKTQERFNGRDVILVEDDIVTPYDSANTDDVVVIFCKLKDYCINSNMQMKTFRWLDHDTNQWINKAILIADGKILDPKGVILIKKGV